MRAPQIAAIAAALVLLASAAQAAGGIYQWKDSKGVTHYSDTPPPSGEGKQRNLHNADPVVAPTSKAPAENPACATARGNIALLNSKQNVQLDSDGDGKPDKALSEGDRANQLALAQATLNTSCSAGSQPAPAAGG